MTNVRSIELGLTALAAVLIAFATLPAAIDMATVDSPTRNGLLAIAITVTACVATLAAIAVPAESLKRAYWLRALVIALLPLAAGALGGSSRVLLYIADVILLSAFLLLVTRALGCRDLL